MKSVADSDGQVNLSEEKWELRLYTAGQTPKSLTAFANLKRLCEEHLKDRYNDRSDRSHTESPGWQRETRLWQSQHWYANYPNPSERSSAIFGHRANSRGLTASPGAIGRQVKQPDKKFDVTREFEKALTTQNETFVLRLYITGMTPRSAEAIASIRTICEKHLGGHYDLEVIDIYQQPSLAKDEQIVAAPTLVKKLPLPLRRLVGNLSQEDRVLLGLDLRRKS